MPRLSSDCCCVHHVGALREQCCRPLLYWLPRVLWSECGAPAARRRRVRLNGLLAWVMPPATPAYRATVSFKRRRCATSKPPMSSVALRGGNCASLLRSSDGVGGLWYLRWCILPTTYVVLVHMVECYRAQVELSRSEAPLSMGETLPLVLYSVYC